MSTLIARIQSAPVALGLAYTDKDEAAVEGTYRDQIDANAVYIKGGGTTIGTDVITFEAFSGPQFGHIITVPADYTGQAIAIPYPNLSLVFLVGWAAATFTFTFRPNRVVPPQYAGLLGDGCPVALNVVSTSMIRGDAEFETFNRKTLLVERAMRRAVSFDVNYLDKAANLSRLVMEHDRQLVTYGEDYKESTIIYVRQGGSVVPWLGPAMALSNSHESTTFDPSSGLIRKVPAAQLARAPGYGTGLADLPQDERTTVPFKDVLLGGSFQVGGPVKNLLPWWVAKPRTSSVNWETDGGVNGGLNERTILHPDDWPVVWDSEILVHFATGVGHAMQTHSVNNVADITGLDGENLCGQTFVRGVGRYKIQVWTGLVTADTLLHEGPGCTLEPDTWKRCWHSDASATIPAGHTVAKIRLESLAIGSSLQIGPAMLQVGNVPGTPLPSAGTPIDNPHELLQIQRPLPPAGSVLFGYYHPGDGGDEITRLVNSGSNKFAIQHNVTADVHIIRVRTDLGSNWLEATIPDFVPGTWLTIAVTWELNEGDLELLDRKVYIDGVLAASDTTDDFTANYLPPTVVGDDDGAGHVRFQNFRVDAEAMSAAEVLHHHLRLSDPAYAELMAEFAGRLMRITSDSAGWDSIPHPDRIRAALTLTEQDRFEPGLVNRS